MKPFLKWAGNKYAIVHAIQDILGELPTHRRLVEPFAGAAAVFLNTPFPHAWVADGNPDLVTLYRQLQTNSDRFIALCRALFTEETNQAEVYYALREEFNAATDPERRASLFLYLNRHGFNGLCRYNSSGGFNVPFGRYKKPYFPEAELRGFAETASRAQFQHADFRESLAQCRPGDFVYCDPPYVALSETANFTAYSAGGFSRRDQEDLAEWARKLAHSGITVLLSNHDTAVTRAVYDGADIRSLSVRRYISCKGDSRQPVPEILALFRPETIVRVPRPKSRRALG